MTRLTGWAAAALVTGVLVGAGACGAGDDAEVASHSSGESAGSCPAQFIYQGRTYENVANVEFTAADELGVATQPPCDDTGGETPSDPAVEEPVYAIEGVPPAIAVAVGDSPTSARLFAVYTGSEIPEEVRRLAESS
ncbi:DUF6281 family protein [Streptomyces sp. NPDC004610]|uniref:DUF6281 family protein n=1 Tax=unclassified Streptomyces TaxID=2593676 RepID=UPI0033A44437